MGATKNKNSYTVFINGQSGTVLNIGADTIRSKIVESGLTDADSVHFLAPDEMNKHLDSFCEKNEGHLLIGGGDGTIRSCAAHLLNHDIPFGIIPLGTMNLLANDIGIPVNLDEVINIYASGAPEAISIDIGIVNGECFLCCAGIGIMPEASHYREKLRKNNDFTLYPKLTAFILERMDISRHRYLDLELPNQRFKMKTASLVVSNNRFIETTSFGENHFKKHSLQDGELGIYALQSRNWVEAVRFLIKLGIGGWKKDPVIKTWFKDKITVHTQNSTELVSLDGEPVDMKTPLKFDVQPQALSLLVPASLKQQHDEPAKQTVSSAA